MSWVGPLQKRPPIYFRFYFNSITLGKNTGGGAIATGPIRCYAGAILWIGLVRCVGALAIFFAMARSFVIFVSTIFSSFTRNCRRKKYFWNGWSNALGKYVGVEMRSETQRSWRLQPGGLGVTTYANMQICKYMNI